MKAFTAGTIFDGTDCHTEAALVVADGKVTALVPVSSLSEDIEIVSYDKDSWIAPGFVDLQVNGGGGIMLNDSPSPETLQTIASVHLLSGTTSFLPTVITDSLNITEAAVSAVSELADDSGILGIHIEGPHISVARRGVHNSSHIRSMTEQDLSLLLNAANNMPNVMVTLAPEVVESSDIERLAEAGICVSLGHSDATFNQVTKAVDAGARCVTHLFNAMSQINPREPGMVGAALAIGQLSASLIADGAHCDEHVIDIALRAKRGPGKIFLVSDAMASTGTKIRSFKLHDREVLRNNGFLQLSDGTLAGSDITMLDALRYMVRSINLPLVDALAMASHYPAQLLSGNLATVVGNLHQGSCADMVVLDSDLSVLDVWRAGRGIDVVQKI